MYRQGNRQCTETSRQCKWAPTLAARNTCSHKVIRSNIDRRPSTAHRTANQTTHHRRPGIRSCSLARVEQSSARCHFCQLTPVFHKTTENFSVPELISLALVLIVYRVLEAFSLKATLIFTLIIIIIIIIITLTVTLTQNHIYYCNPHDNEDGIS